ncbi:amidohydrolase [Lachnospiraceae bacterium PM6-15]|uniref:M20 metallopeptidase family protein n=1 Tax=Ohessyouella blattaphilus TaxID=2949333 RepID=UPI003E263D93
MKYLEEAKAIEEEIIANRRYVHQHAEIGLDLPVTKTFVMEKLKEMGYEPQDCARGVVALVGGKKPGKVFLLRADMDALPIQEEGDHEFKSETGSMHACGHDMHTAMLLGAARILKQHEDEIEGTIKLMFQPAEESLLGAIEMVEAGILENPKVDAAAFVHVFSGMPLASRSVIMPEAGSNFSAADWFEIHVQGKGCHGAMPNTGVDPLNVITHIYQALQSIHAREMPTGASLALTMGQLHGGAVSNVIPDTAFMSGTIRTRDESVRAFVLKRIEEISDGIARTFRAEATVKFPTQCPAMASDSVMVDQVKELLPQILSEDQILDLGEKSGIFKTGSEDFAHVSTRVPAVFLALGAGNSEDGYEYPLHHPKVFFDEGAMPVGTATYVGVAMEWLKKYK